MPIHIATATLEDHGAVWDILAPTIAAGETYPLPRDLDRANALAYWFSPSHEAFVARDDGEIAGTYYLRSNCLAGGAHVANCGYVTGAWATGRGIGRAMCEHSIARAHARLPGYAVQSRGEYQPSCRAALATLRLRDRRAIARGVSSPANGVRRRPCHVSDARVRTVAARNASSSPQDEAYGVVESNDPFSPRIRPHRDRSSRFTSRRSVRCSACAIWIDPVPRERVGCACSRESR